MDLLEPVDLIGIDDRHTLIVGVEAGQESCYRFYRPVLQVSFKCSFLFVVTVPVTKVEGDCSQYLDMVVDDVASFISRIRQAKLDDELVPEPTSAIHALESIDSEDIEQPTDCDLITQLGDDIFSLPLPAQLGLTLALTSLVATRITVNDEEAHFSVLGNLALERILVREQVERRDDCSDDAGEDCSPLERGITEKAGGV